MREETASLLVKRNYLAQLSVGIFLLLLGGLLDGVARSVTINALSGIVISVSVALNIWTLFQSGQKIPLIIRTQSPSGSVILIGKKAISAQKLAKILINQRGHAILLQNRGNPLLNIQIRSEESHYPKLLSWMMQFAKEHQVPME
jgi:hypothetical protein